MTRREAFIAGAAMAANPPVSGADRLPLGVILRGTETPEPRRIRLTAGPLSASFEPELGFLRYIRFGEQEVLRGIYAAVRDSAWRTIAPQVSKVKIDDNGRAFIVAFEVACREGNIDFIWQGNIRGDRDGTIRFTMDGSARSTFLRNRIGFCVLHPMRECAGRPCSVRLSDGKMQEGRFPDLISPHQPFRNVRAITHEVAPGLHAEVVFEGDIFEMEDHRNWTDGNFKTYCTPLERPFPVSIEKGTRVAQSITVRLRTDAMNLPAPRASADQRVRLELTSGKRKLPEIGFGVDPAATALTAVEIGRVKQLRPAHLRVDISLGDPDWRSRLRRAWRDAAAVGARLECALFVSDAAEDELREVKREEQEPGMRVARWLIFHRSERSTGAKWMEIARRELRPRAGTLLASGTNHYFTELNRERPPVAVSDAICYSINPQVHAFDNASLVENLEAQAHTVRTARSFAADRWLAVTPVTLRPRFNPNASSAPASATGGLPDRVDPRQMSLFGAAWTAGSIKYLAESGVDSATFYETVGWAGLMERAAGSANPGRFRSIAGGVFPLYHVFADAADFAGGSVVSLRSSDPLRADALLLERNDRRRLIVANLTPQEQAVEAPGFTVAGLIRTLDASSFEPAAVRPVEWRRGAAMRVSAIPSRVPPYAVITIDLK
jgi:hypothetical protein